jgi:hypothetical protein
MSATGCTKTDVEMKIERQITDEIQSLAGKMVEGFKPAKVWRLRISFNLTMSMVLFREHGYAIKGQIITVAAEMG